MKLENFNNAKNIVKSILENEEIKRLLSRHETRLAITNIQNDYSNLVEITRGNSALKIAVIDYIEKETEELRKELEEI